MSKYTEKIELFRFMGYEVMEQPYGIDVRFKTKYNIACMVTVYTHELFENDMIIYLTVRKMNKFLKGESK